MGRFPAGGVTIGSGSVVIGDTYTPAQFSGISPVPSKQASQAGASFARNADGGATGSLSSPQAANSNGLARGDSSIVAGGPVWFAGGRRYWCGSLSGDLHSICDYYRRHRRCGLRRNCWRPRRSSGRPWGRSTRSGPRIESRMGDEDESLPLSLKLWVVVPFTVYAILMFLFFFSGWYLGAFD